MRLDAAPEYANMVERIVHGIKKVQYEGFLMDQLVVERCVDSPACMWLAVTF